MNDAQHMHTNTPKALILGSYTQKKNLYFSCMMTTFNFGVFYVVDRLIVVTIHFKKSVNNILFKI